MSETQFSCLNQDLANNESTHSSQLYSEIVQNINRLDVSNCSDGSLPHFLIAEAETDLYEKLEWVDRDVEALRDMVLAEDGLNSRTDKLYLLSFLRARKFDYEKAMAMIRGYYTVQKDNLEIFRNLCPSSLQHIWPLQIQTVLSKPDSKGRTVLIFSIEHWDPEVITLDDIFRAQILLLEHIVRVPITQLKGVTAIVDCKGLSLNHAYYVTPFHITRMVSIIQEVFPLRFKALHFVHEPSIFDWVFSLIKPFLSETIKGRLHFHGENLEELYEETPKEILPAELGGNAGPLNNNYLVDALLENEDYFKEQFSYGYLNNEVTADVAESSDVQTTILNTVSGVGSLLGSYYRKMCID